MQQWEYLQVVVEPNNKNQPYKAIEANGQSLAQKRGAVLGGSAYPLFTDYISDLGSEGWELITVVGDDSIYGRKCFTAQNTAVSSRSKVESHNSKVKRRRSILDLQPEHSRYANVSGHFQRETSASTDGSR